LVGAFQWGHHHGYTFLTDVCSAKSIHSYCVSVVARALVKFQSEDWSALHRNRTYDREEFQKPLP
jgi:hypothetical protein